MKLLRIKEELATLRNVDLWSLTLFALYKVRDVPEYSTLSELAYVLDKDNMLKLCEYFGGTTIRVPTIAELEGIVQALVLYQYVNIDGMEYEEAVKMLGESSCDYRTIKSNYSSVCDVLNQYSFQARGG